MSEIVYLNGEFIGRKDAKASVWDLGFLYGGGIYEVVLLLNKRLYRLKEHLQRLEVSASLIDLPVEVSDLEQICKRLVEANQSSAGKIYIQITFGQYGRRIPVIPTEVIPTIFIAIEDNDSRSSEYYKKGIRIKSDFDTRWEHCNIKSVALLPNLLALNLAAKEGYQEVVFYDKETGNVTECASSNIFCVRGGTLYTPPESSKILSGITRSVILELAGQSGLNLSETDFSIELLRTADEVFVSSTTKEIVPVRSIDNSEISSEPGEITRKLMLLLIEDLELRTGGKHPRKHLLFPATVNLL